MIVATYEKWKKEQLAVIQNMPEEDREVDCPECHGEGEYECDCCGHERECDRCEGYGHIDISDSEEHQPSKQKYFSQVVTEVKQFCAWCNRDFLGEIGPFVREFRVGKH
ncbi:hypothetical protein [uncultured Amphritea sp.]|uniref:hypothetical protein n=1 Tax=uncultured Amphritea sp. TaxID=981605 RepID=UPI0026241B0E|nr:hypothetical protein [uncultured Amphritea sp.]